MSRAARWSTSVDAATLGLVAVGLALMVGRAWLPALGPSGRIVGLAAVLLAILVGSLLVPTPHPRPATVRPVVTLAVGLAAIAIAAAAGRPPARAPFVSWALPLAMLAAVAEEALFRRAAYGALERCGALVAVGATALAFALVHVPLYGVAAFPVDLGAGLLLSWQRWASGTWTVPAATHAAANLLMTVMR